MVQTLPERAQEAVKGAQRNPEQASGVLGGQAGPKHILVIGCRRLEGRSREGQAGACLKEDFGLTRHLYFFMSRTYSCITCVVISKVKQGVHRSTCAGVRGHRSGQSQLTRGSGPADLWAGGQGCRGSQPSSQKGGCRGGHRGSGPEATLGPGRGQEGGGSV